MGSHHRREALSSRVYPILITMTSTNDSVIPHQQTLKRSSSTWDRDLRGKLFQRDNERAQLLTHYYLSKDSNHPNQFVLLRGKTGTGKTALACSLRSVAQGENGYFVEGKFDQLRRPEPHAVIASAFGTFAKDVLDRGDNEIQRLQESVKPISGEVGILTTLIPELEKVLGVNESAEQEPYTGDPSSEAANRFKHAFRLFLRAIGSSERPLVFFLDDAHWADEVALDLLSSLVQDEGIVGCMFMCTYRTDDTPTNHRLEQILSQFNDNVSVTQMSVCELHQEATRQMVAELFRFDQVTSDALASRMYTQTRGNIFFMIEYLKALHETGSLWYSDRDDTWSYDEAGEGIVFDCIGDLIRSKIKGLPDRAQETLSVAACLGSRVDKDILCKLSTVEVVMQDLALIARKGLIRLNDREVYEFAHDGIQEATYELISEAEQARLHHRIGIELWKNLDLNELDEHIFMVVGQLMVGTSHVTNERERVAIAKLCLRAGERAVLLSSFHMAYSYLMHGISLLGQRRWRDEYRLCLDLYSAAAEVAYCTTHFEQAEKLFEDTLANIRRNEDASRIQATKIYTIATKGDLDTALTYGLKALESVGIKLVKNPTKVGMFFALRRIRNRLKVMSDEAILRLPTMEDPEKLAAMHILNLVNWYALLMLPSLTAYATEKIISLTLEHGISAVSAFGFSLYASILCS